VHSNANNVMWATATDLAGDGSGHPIPTPPAAEGAAGSTLHNPAAPQPHSDIVGFESGISSDLSTHYSPTPTSECGISPDTALPFLPPPLSYAYAPSVLPTPASELNTTIRYPLFTPHQLPTPPSPLKIEGWRALLSDHPDRNFVDTLLGIITYGARVGYEGPRRNPVIYANLSTAALEPTLLDADL
jgi:hypothetical protein